ncbi:MAG: alpha/beta fold hydrolase, partial [Thermoflexales bacterium]|nr:alpha/beta fold hydrolase [Thermoflexales bacterium]
MLLGLLCASLLQIRSAHAEIPILETHTPNGDYGLLEDSPYIEEPWFMWFVLGELSSARDVDMVKFDYKGGDRFKAVIFIPGHEELRAFNPTIALIGPGLPVPEGPLPFDLPAGYGVITATSETTYDYFDIFTQMVYFPRAQIELDMPQTGRYYVAVWGKPVGMARYALDIGIMENFAPHVLARYPINWWEVRDYLRWGHRPAVLAPPLFALALLLALRRRLPASAFERAAPAISLFGLTGALVFLNAQQATWSLVQPITALGISGAIVLAVLGAIVWSAYLLTPLRERYNLREAAGNGNFAWVDGCALHYSDDGAVNVPAAVLIHGFASSMFTWRHVKADLLRAGYRVITVDLLGYGASARPAEPVYSTEHQARLVLGLLDQLGVATASFIGHSFGGRVALQVALLAPTRVRSLVLLSPEAFTIGRPRESQWVRLPILGYVLAFYSTSPLLVRPGLRFVTRRHEWITRAV